MESAREILKAVRRIELGTRRVVQSRLTGSYHSAFKGQGMAFEDVRPYVPGDDVRHIDWNVSARHPDVQGSALFVRTFREERELTVLLMVDVSGSASFGTRRRSKLRLQAELAAMLAFSALRNNDRVGLLRFSDRVEQWLPPRKGRSHGLRVIRDVVEGEAESRRTCLRRALETLNRVQRRRAVVFLCTDFMDEGWEDGLRAAASRHDVVAFRLYDPAEFVLPDLGLVHWADLETGERRWVDLGNRRNRQLYAEASRRRGQEVTRRLRQLDVDVVDLDTREELVTPLARFFEERRRRR
ncbi:MAG: DUF58 domain-containing protein [Myxococcota bacterium]